MSATEVDPHKAIYTKWTAERKAVDWAAMHMPEGSRLKSHDAAIPRWQAVLIAAVIAGGAMAFALGAVL